MVTVYDAIDYMGIDYPDERIEANVKRALNAARAKVLGSVGDDVETYFAGDPRLETLILMHTDELYSDRGVISTKAINASRELVNTLELQLRLELRQAKEAAGGSA